MRCLPGLLLAALVCGACSVASKPDFAVDRSADATMSNTTVRAWVDEYRRSLVEQVRDIAFDSYLDDPAWLGRQHALVFGIFVERESARAARHADGVVAVIDIWTLVRQLEAFFESGDGVGMFPEYRTQLLEMFAVYDEQARSGMDQLGDQALAAQAEELIEDWVEEWPIVGTRMRRVSTLPMLTEVFGSRSSTVFDRVASIEDTAARIDTSVADMTYDLPVQISLQAALLIDTYLEMAESSGLRSLVDRVVALLESLPAWGERQRVEVLDALERMRVETLAEVRAERAEVLRQLGEERGLVLAAIRDERVAALEEVDRQRRETLDAVLATVAAERSVALEAIETMRVSTVASMHEEVVGLSDRIDQMREQTIDRVDARVLIAIERGLDGILWRGLVLMAAAGAAVFALAWFVLRGLRPR